MACREFVYISATDQTEVGLTPTANGPVVSPPAASGELCINGQKEWVVRWTHENVLSFGAEDTYEVKLVASLRHPITDGHDRDSNGVPALYGVGELVDGTVFIDVSN